MMMNDDDDDGSAEREETLGNADGSVVVGDDDDDDDETGSVLDLSLESSSSSSSNNNREGNEDIDDHSGGVVVVVDAEDMEGLEFEDDEDWSSEEDDDDDDHGVAVQVQHHHEHEHENVFCDECGCNPIVGVRYKSTMQNNYDICRECLEENHDNDTAGLFALARPVRDEAAVNRLVMTRTTTTRRKSLTFYSLQALIHNRFVQDPHSEIDDITLELSVTGTTSTTLTDAQADQATRLIAQHTRIKEMEIQVHASTTTRRRRRHNTNNNNHPSTLITKAMVAVARGLAQNKSVQSVAWTILYGRNNCFCLEDDAYQALHDLVTQSTSIRYLFVFTECDDMYGITTTGTPEATILQSNRKLENCLFDGLFTTSVDTIRLQNNHCKNNHNNQNNDHLFHVSNDNKKKAWKAIKENPKLRRIKATFETNDYMLELLRLDKKHEWTKRWCNENDDNETQCWDILVEAAATGAATNIDNPHGGSSAGAGGACVMMMDPVFVIYHLLRSRPQVIRHCGGSV